MMDLPDLDVSSVVDLKWTVHRLAEGVIEVRATPSEPALVKVAWQVPCVDAVAYWTPDSNEHRGLPPSWRQPRTVSLVKGAPIACLIGSSDRAICTVALGEVVRPVRIRAGVVEETGDFGFWVEHYADPSFVLRLDLSGRPFAQTLADAAAWWPGAAERSLLAGEARPGGPGLQPNSDRVVPRVARMPVYSTWYAMQQNVSESNVEKQAALAADLGCESIIVDDGWHSTDRGRGYGYVGEWEPTFPDIRAHVSRVPLAYLLWYALPFVGRHTALWDSAKLLAIKERMDAGVVDPRYPEVRNMLVEKLSRAVNEWGMDGLKVDFIDQFALDDDPTVVEGVHELMRQLADAVPGALIELRQPYVSPGLWPYATMIRASDCPLSPVQNRQRTVDLRLIAGPLAVHADMMMWHPSESPARVAVQLINVLFAVPQISVDLSTQTPEQLAVLRFWLRFFIEHADVLQGGVFEPSRPDLGYPLVRAIGDGVVIAARYGPVPVPLEPGHRLLLANADSPDVIVTTSQPCTVDVAVHDCAGGLVKGQRLELDSARVIHVPVGGLLKINVPPGVGNGSVSTPGGTMI